MNPIGTKRISKPPNGVILNELIGIWRLQRVYLGTLAFGKSVLKGSQSVLFIPSVQHGPLRTHHHIKQIDMSLRLNP